MASKTLSIPLKTGGNGDTISAVLTTPDAPVQIQPQGIVIAHGAANDKNNPLIKAVADGLAREGFACLRFNFLYRELQKKSVDPEHRLVHAWQQAIATMHEATGCTRLIAMGKSLGARIAAQAAASSEIAPEGLIFLGYPLHAPGRKDKLRDAPFQALTTPMLFFEGTRDPFCDLELLDRVFNTLDSRPDLTVIENADHSFNLPKSDPRSDDQIYQQVITHCLDWLRGT